MLDLLIKGGTIVDGSGRAGYVGDVGVREGKIAAIGRIDETARVTVDATGRVVAPGFIDVHTHYDAQAFWEPTLSPTCYHGVTTVIGGFCGFSIAPLTEESAGYLQRMLARVEGMPLATLQSAVPWDWTSFGDFLAKLDNKIGLNAGFFVGHSAIRRAVMDSRAVGETATQDDIASMKALLATSLAEGALGFSTTVSATHNDADGQPVPSRWADREEFIALASVVKDYEGTGLEMLPDIDFPPGMAQLMADFSCAGNRAVNWNVLAVTGRPDAAEVAKRQLEVSDLARKQGGEVVALTIPTTPGVYLSLRTGMTFDALPGAWATIATLSHEDKIARFGDPAFRQQLVLDAARQPVGSVLEPAAKFADFTISSVAAEENKRYVGQRIGEIAEKEGREAIDVMLDIALGDDLETNFCPDFGGDDLKSYQLRSELWADDRTLIGGSDAGAHLDLIDTFSFATALLQKGVREHKVIGLERAIHEITERPAKYFGLVDRGTIKEGYHADLVVFDPDTVGCGLTYKRYDLPGGEDFRLYADAEGIDHVFVNGIQVVRDAEHTGELPGTVLRSGRDTITPPIDVMRTRPLENV